MVDRGDVSTRPRRRLVLGGLGAGLVAASARAEPWLRDDVVVYCDPTLKPVFSTLGARFLSQTGVHLRIFSTAPGQMLELLARGTQDDILITLSPALAEAAKRGLVGGSGVPLWRNRLSIAGGRATTSSPSFDQAGLLRQLGTQKFAAPDPTPASTVDGPAVLEKLGLSSSLQGRLIGGVTPGACASLVGSGAAGLGLCHLTDIRATPGLHQAMPVPEQAYEPISYSVALTKTAWSRHQRLFLGFLADPEAADLARAAGLENAS